MPTRRRVSPPAAPIARLPTAPWDPWQPVFLDAALVVPMRLALMPWLALVDPAAARREARLMVDEKLAAYGESLIGLWLAPLRYWTGLATLAVAPGAAGVERAFAEASRAAARPYGRRVRANRRRLARGG